MIRSCFASAAVLVLSCVWAVAQPAAPAPARSRELAALLDEYYDRALSESPLTATQRGDDRFNDQLERVSPEAYAQRREHARALLARLGQLDAATWSEEDRTDAGLLRLVLGEAIEEARFFPEQTPLDDREGPQIWLPQTADRLVFTTDRHYRDFAARLEAVPRLIDEHIGQMRLGLAAGRVPPRISVGQTADQAMAQASDAIKADPTQSPFYRPFLARPKGDELAARARRAVAEGIVPAYERLARFLRDEYIPRCRETTAASAGVDGLAGYEFQLRRHTTTGLSAQQIHEMGLREVARIRQEMFAVIERSDWPDKAKHPAGSDERFNAFIAYLRSEPRFYARSEDELLRAYRDIAKRIDPELAGLFGKLPRTPYGVRPIARFAAPSSPTAYYYPGSSHGGVPGFFLANTHALDQRPRYEMVSLTLHEAVPGHHLQISLADELDNVHPFRSLMGFTVFVEGWALYAERLGLEMAGAPPRREADGTGGGTGLFADPYDDFGRLTYEMWRACRLVVDPGLHALGWSRQQAIDFMLRNTALSPLNIEREVDRYIAWPGQATGYKIGELKIRELRARAERALGDRFDRRAFHDRVLGAGAVPLSVLEERIDRWIEQTKGRG
jgi:uncharacterized protein (DUF885 family)